MFIWWFWTQAVNKEVPNKMCDFWQFEGNWCLMLYGNSHGYSSMKMYLQIQQRENIEKKSQLWKHKTGISTAAPSMLTTYSGLFTKLWAGHTLTFSDCGKIWCFHIADDAECAEMQIWGYKYTHVGWWRSLVWRWTEKKNKQTKKAVESFYWTAKSYLFNTILIWLQNYHIVKIHLSTTFK